MSGTSQLLEELSEFCRSDSLSEGGMRGIIERHGIIALNNNITDYKFFHSACYNERLTEGILRYLLEYFPNAARAVGEGGRLPLHNMLGRNKNVTLGMVQLLIDAYPESVRRENNKGWMPLHLLCVNKDLDEEIGLEILMFLLEKGPKSVRHTTENGNLPIHSAAALNSPGFCRLLIEAYPGSERITNIYGYLPFHAACQCNTVATAKYLYQLYPESMNVADDNGWYPIHSAIWGLKLRSNPNDGIEVAKFLLDCNPDALSSTGKTPLHTAISSKHVTLSVVQLLIDAFPESLSHENNIGLMPLHKLCANKYLDEEIGLEILMFLLKKCQESVRHTTENGNLPIHAAAALNSPDFCRKLIEAYPGSERITNDNGSLPFHLACIYNTVATAKYLYQLYPESINVANNDGWHPIHHAIAGLENRSNPIDSVEVLKFLLEYNPDALSSTGHTPLHIICINKNVTLKIVQLLIDAFPDSLCHEDNIGLMPLHQLCCNDYLDEEIGLEILNLLLEKCPESVRHATRNGNLPIHLAAATQSLEFYRILIGGYPGSERITNDNGQIPFHSACRCNTVATVKYLYQLYPESINVAGNRGRYPIHYAILGLKDRPETAIEMVQFLLRCDPNVVSQKLRGKLPLYWVCNKATNVNTPKLNAYLNIVQMLYDTYPEAIESNEITSNVGSFCAEVQTFINVQLTYARQAKKHHLITTPDEDGQLPLHKALRENSCLGSIKLLVKGNTSAVRCPDNTGMIPLHVACQNHASVSVIEYLIDLYAFALETKDRSQNTLLHFACRGANHTIITLLLERPAASFVSTRNLQRQLPIDLLFESEAVSDRNDVKYVESIYRLLRAYPETLMNSNSDVNIRPQATSNDGKKRKFSDL